MITSSEETSYVEGKTYSEFAYKLSAGTLLSLTDHVSLDVTYQYVNLGDLEGDRGLHSTTPGGSGPGYDMSSGLMAVELKPTN